MSRTYRAGALALALTVAFTIMLSGCGKTAAPDSQGQAAANGTSAAQNDVSGSNMTESGFPTVKEPITIRIFGQKGSMHAPWEDMLVFKEYEKMTNVKVIFETAPEQGFAEKKSLLFASNELPDAFVRAGLSSDEITKYGLNGALAPLEDLIDKNAPNIKMLFDQYPDAKKSLISPDGHIYAMATIVTLNAARTGLKPWINKTWLERVGKKAPATLDELTDVLKAFKDQDFNGDSKINEIPMSASSINDMISVFAGSWGMGTQMGFNIKIYNGKANIWMTDDRFRELLTYLNKLYKDGLIDRELFTQDYAKYLSKVNSQSLGIFYIQTDDSFDSTDFMGMAPYKGPYGDQLVSSVGPVSRDMGTFAISTVNKYPAETMRWIDYFYGDEGSIFFRYGVEGQTYTKQADGSVEYKEEILKDTRGKGTAIGQFTIWPGGGAPHWINDKNSTAINSKATQQAQQALEPYLPEMVYGPPLFDQATSEKVLTLKADIMKYYDESVAKFVIGDLSFDKWNEYVATMDKIGIKELEQIYQNALDTINK